MDSIEYLDPENINGLNLYAYCGNNPVVRVDYNGNSFLSFLAVLAITWAISSIASYYLGEHLVSGASSVYGGVQTIATGISLLAYGPVGWVLGGTAIVLGAVNIAFGTAEIQQHFTGNNWINDVGIIGGLYTWLYAGTSIASVVVSIGGNYYKTTTYGQRAYALQNVKKFRYTNTVKQHMMDSGYFGKKYGSTGITTKNTLEIRSYTNSLWAQKTIIKYGTMTVDKFGWVFTYDGYRLGVNNAKHLIWHFGHKF